MTTTRHRPQVHDTPKLKILAGPAALRHIRSHGLSPQDVSMVFGASGAAKWLTIASLDIAVFGRFLNGVQHTINLFGTSIGAFKLAAAAQSDPEAALRRLADAYVEQRYAGEITPATVSAESSRITGLMLGNEGIDQILSHPHFRFHCGTVRGRGLLASDKSLAQKLSMAGGFVLAAAGRRHLRAIVHRVVFSDPRALASVAGEDGFPTRIHALERDNFAAALLASGSIPIVMAGVRGLPAAGDTGVFRDGGLLDYHPVPSNLSGAREGLVLYPHFYPHLIEGWFDKFFRGRQVRADRLDNVVLLAPSEGYVASLPGGAIPDRKDFYTFAGNDDERERRWHEAIGRSEELGEEFIELTTSGRIASVVKPI